MTKLKLSPDLSLPMEVAGQTIGILGIRGGGKTNTAGVLAEELLDRNQPIAVIDPTDGWWGLRSEYPVFIFGGEHGDLPLEETSGKTIAEFVVHEQVPVILSVLHLPIAAQRRLVAAFCLELFHLKGQEKLRGPLTVIIDEAPLFIPQRATGESARVVNAVENLVARGRRLGFGCVLISQRSATINKDVLTQADTLIVHRLTGLPDRKVLSEWMQANASTGEHKDALESLAALPKGHAWIWAPSLDIFKKVHVRKRHTFDSSASPVAGKAVRPPKDLAQIDLAKLKGDLAATIERQKADDPALLRRRIAELEAALKKKQPVAKAVPIPKPERVPYIPKKIPETLRRAQLLIAEVQKIASESAIIAHGTPSRPTPVADLERAFQPPVQRSLENSPENGLRSGAIRILKELAARYPATYTRPQVGVLTRFTHTGGTFTTYLGDLKRAGYIEERGAELIATEAGIASLGGDLPRAPTTHQEAMALWRGALRKGAFRMLEAIVAAGQSGIAKEDVAAAVDMEVTGGTFTTYLGDIRRNGLATDRSGVWKALDILYP